MQKIEDLNALKAMSEAGEALVDYDTLKKAVEEGEIERTPEIDEMLSKLDDAAHNLEEHLTAGRQELARQLKENGYSVDELRDSVMRNLIESRKAAELAGNSRAISLFDGLIKQHRDAKSLTFLMQKGTGKAPKVDSKSYKELQQRVRQKLASNKKYTFTDPKSLDAVLEAALPDEYKPYSRAFMMRFYGFVDRVQLNPNAILVSHVISKIAGLGRANRDENFLIAVTRVIDRILGRD